MARALFVSTLLAAFLGGSLEGTACAFEREWHVGGGVGLATANSYKRGPAVNLYGAYGISDVFDLRLELTGSSHYAKEYRSRYPDPSSFYAGKLALAYKLDVIQWIPYVGLSAGYLVVTKTGAAAVRRTAGLPKIADPVPPFAVTQPTAGILLGLDYAASRDLGFGGLVSYDYAFHPGAAYAAAFLRAEYHFGF